MYLLLRKKCSLAQLKLAMPVGKMQYDDIVSSKYTSFRRVQFKNCVSPEVVKEENILL